jgi:hypothetical protein
MKVQNVAMPNSSLSLRYARDDNGAPVIVCSDAEGIFEVPEKEGNILVGLPGWQLPVRKPALAETPAFVPPPAPVAPVAEEKGLVDSAPIPDSKSVETNQKPAKKVGPKRFGHIG